MAKVCCNCGKKISFGGEYYKLKASMEILCSACGRKVAPLLDDLSNAADLESFRRKSKELKELLEYSNFSYKAKQNVEYELQRISDKQIEALTGGFDGGVTFEATFEESYDMVLLSGDGEIVGKPLIVDLGTTKAVSFVFEQYFLRNGSYASLSVTLVHCDGRAYVTAVGAGGGEGILNISWGAEGDYQTQFWHNLHAKYPHIDIQPYQVKIMDELKND